MKLAPLARRCNLRSAVSIALTLVAVVVFSLHPAAAATTTNDMGDVFSSLNTGNSGIGNLFSWKIFLNALLYVGLPVMVTIGVFMLINRIQDEQSPKALVWAVISGATMIGLLLVVAAVPAKMAAASNGALVHVSSAVTASR